MSDNLNVTAGSGRTVRAKDIGSGAEKLLQYLGAVTAIPTPITGNQAALSVGSSVVSLTVPTGATHALISVNTGGGDIRFWEDGSSPTAAQGLLIQAGETAEITNLANIKLIATTGTVTVQVAYRRYDL